MTMTTDDDNEDNGGAGGTDGGAAGDAGSIDPDTLKNAIRDVIAEMGLGAGTDDDQDPSSDPEPITVKDVEAAARRAVEDAMAPLREAVAKKSAGKPKPKPKPAPVVEDSPAQDKSNRWRRIMWGSDDD